MQPIIQIEDLTVSFSLDLPPAVCNLSFSVQQGETLGIVGESGSGKTLTALAMMQLLPSAASVSPQSRILYAGNDLLSLPERQMRQIRGHVIGLIFQDAMSAFNPVQTIEQQMYETLALHFNLSKRKARQRSHQLLDEVGIVDPARCLQSYPHQLSGGMRQRAMIAMVLAAEPTIIIADEPTTALDVTIQAQVIDCLRELNKKRDMTLLFVSHDLALVSNLVDEVIVMRQGKCVEQASSRAFFSAPRSAYSQRLLASIPTNEPRQTIVPGAEALLTIENLKVHFPIKKGILQRTVGAVKAVDGISFSVPEGQTLALVGESGSGKTTVAKAMLGLNNRQVDRYDFMKMDCVRQSRRVNHYLRHQTQIVFQDPYAALNPRLLVVDAIAEGLLAQGLVRNRQQALPRVDELLEQVSLPLDCKWRYPHEFSGGERQRICIARALALDPRLLILDEPTSALDVSIQMQILDLLESLQQRLRLSYLLITHNIAVVAHMAHYLAVMYHGKLVEQGETAKLLASPQEEYTQRLLRAVPVINLFSEEVCYE